MSKKIIVHKKVTEDPQQSAETKKKSWHKIFAVIAVPVAVCSLVFNAIQFNSVMSLSSENDSLSAEIEAQEKTITELTKEANEADRIQKLLDNTKQQHSDTKALLSETQKQLDELQKKYDQLSANNYKGSTPQAEPKVVVEDSKITEAIKRVDATLTGFDYHKIVYDENGFTINTSSKGLAQSIRKLKKNGYDNTYKTWETITDEMINLGRSTVKLIESYGIDNPTVTMNTVDYDNPATVLQSIKNGKVVYDYLAN